MDIVARCGRWMVRFRKRRGYGIHSPFAFGLVTGVIYEHGNYYAYERLDRLYREQRAQATLRLKDYRLLFRLANFQHPRCCLLLGTADGLLSEFLHAGSLHTQYVTAAKTADMVVVQRDAACDPAVLAATLEPGAMVVVVDPRGSAKRRRAWRALLELPQAQVSFDLHDFGIVLYRPELQRAHYTINYW